VITTPDGREVGVVTSGGFGPSVNGRSAMGYVSRDASAVGTPLHLVVRGKPLPRRW
jgi:aminomethyltransferase